MARERYIKCRRSCPKAHTGFNKSHKFKRKEARKKQKVVDRQKAKAIAEKQQKDRGRSSPSIENDRYYDSKTFTDIDQDDGLNLLRDD